MGSHKIGNHFLPVTTFMFPYQNIGGKLEASLAISGGRGVVHLPPLFLYKVNIAYHLTRLYSTSRNISSVTIFGGAGKMTFDRLKFAMIHIIIIIDTPSPMATDVHLP
mmetsp:Transcript_10506/g.16922  ORF Transcript_10506/g.16922 Transcript_10506/m.16922 type:complete len:108 (+) Transcript_10506:98-421(+)